MRVVVDARLQSGVPGGIEQVALGLAAGVSEEPDTGDRYDFFVTDTRWIEGFVKPPAHVVVAPSGHRRTIIGSVGRALRSFQKGDGVESDPALDRSAADVIDLLRQNSPITSLPTIYHPYDLQHLHLPGFFRESELAARSRLYAEHCRRAAYVVMMTEWAKDDLCERLGVSPGKVAVIPLPPFLRLLPKVDDAAAADLRAGLGLPADFALFPAQTWPHKNHLRLLHALALLRERGCVVPLVCCGTQNRFFEEIARAGARLGLEDQVHHLGWVDHHTLHALYVEARCLVFPSLFEGWGMPITEAFDMELPVACSDAPWLPDLARDAAVLFDPTELDSIASAIESVWTDEDVRVKAVKEGTAAVARLQWSEVTAISVALYRSVAGMDLSRTDAALLHGAGVE